MLYGLAGTHCSGKTTLGRAVSEEMGIVFVQTSITGMTKKHGFDAVGQMELFERIRLQEALLKEMEELIQGCERPAILDRTPLDLVGYLMAEVTMHSGKSLQQKERNWISSYVTKCQAMTSLYFDHVFVTCALPEFTEAEDGKARPSSDPGYQKHVDLLINGALATTDTPIAFSQFSTCDHAVRLKHVCDTIETRLNAIYKAKKSSLHIH